MSGERQFWWELRWARLGPDRMFSGVRCDFPVIEFVQVKADPNPMPRFTLRRKP